MPGIVEVRQALIEPGLKGGGMFWENSHLMGNLSSESYSRFIDSLIHSFIHLFTK